MALEKVNVYRSLRYQTHVPAGITLTLCQPWPTDGPSFERYLEPSYSVGEADVVFDCAHRRYDPWIKRC